MEEILAGEPLISYLPAFQRTGFTDVNFVLNEDSDGWQMMLDVVADDLAAQGQSLKPGHRMMIMSRLKKAKVEMERAPDESRQRNRPPSPATLMRATSHEDSRDEQKTSACATFLDGFKPLLNVPIGWRIALMLALFTLSLVLWGLYQAGANQVGTDVAGGWLFVKVLYISGFVMTGIVAALGACDAIRTRDAAAPAFEFPDCTGLINCNCNCLEGIQRPTFNMDCSKFYKIVCCQCSIQID